ncbi:hypothetical protein [Kineococcus xinjiangensis]|nr:hypothetical protein [Kineococcus xinjiangensis]
MDPSWFLRIEAPFREADLLVFSDGRLDLSWYDPRDLDAGMRNEGHGHLSPTSLVALLERLVRPEGAV